MSDLPQPPSSHSEPSSDKPDPVVTQAHLRENSDPYEENRPVPFVVMFGFFLLFAWGGFYFANYKGDFRVDVYDPNWKPGSGAATEEVAFDPLKRGERLFATNCQACHQATGAGVPGAFPPLAGSRWVSDDDGTRMVKVMLRGMQGPIEVLGEKYNGNMPSYGENGLNWNDRDVAAVATWVRQAWANSAEAVSEERVKEIREEIASHGSVWKGEEIMAAHPLK